jgi:hypothetical protein
VLRSAIRRRRRRRRKMRMRRRDVVLNALPAMLVELS